MEARRRIICEIRKVLLISVGMAVIATFIIAAAGYITPAVIGGAATGLICGSANFCLLAAAVLRISTATEASAAGRAMQRSYMLRMGFMAVFSIAAIVLLRVNPLMHAAMLVLPGIAVRFGHR